MCRQFDSGPRHRTSFLANSRKACVRGDPARDVNQCASTGGGCEAATKRKTSGARKPVDRSAADVALYYSQFYGRMRDDLGRVIGWQHEHPQARAGNMLCALGLVVYTEALGRLAIEELEARFAGDREAFYCFLDRMGDTYRLWHEEWDKTHRQPLYTALRGGLAHEYLPKVPTKLWFEGDEAGGVGADPQFDLHVRLEPFCDDFCLAAERLFAELGVNSNATPEDGVGEHDRAS